jgi:hypothetical protein
MMEHHIFLLSFPDLGGVAQLVEHSYSQGEDMSSFPSTTKNKDNWVPVAHIYNSSYMGGGDWEDGG